MPTWLYNKSETPEASSGGKWASPSEFFRNGDHSRFHYQPTKWPRSPPRVPLDACKMPGPWHSGKKGGCNSTLGAWNKLKTILGRNICIPSDTELWNNPAVTIQGEVLKCPLWAKAGIRYFSDIIYQNKIRSFEYFETKFKLPKKEIFQYLRLKNWLGTNFIFNYEQQKSNIEELLLNKGEKKKLIGKTYGLLIEAQIGNYSLQKIYERWNNDLRVSNIADIWKECLNETKYITANENLRLIQYKLMTRIYYTKSRINTFDPSSSVLCIKCDSHEDTIFHAFWDCYKIQSGWKEIHEWLTQNASIRLELTPQLYIIQNTNKLKYPLGWIVNFSALVYKKLILKHWKNVQAPTLQEWKGLMKYYIHIHCKKGFSNQAK